MNVSDLLVPDFVTASEEAALLGAIDRAEWRNDLRRRVQHYGWRYDYNARRVDGDMRLGPLPDWADGLAARLAAEGVFASEPDQVIVNEYLPGQGIAAHVDCRPCFGPVVASLSLGSASVMRLDDPATGEIHDLPLPPRSLLVLAGAARDSWRHGIAARKSDIIGGVRVMRGRRVSLTFRTICLGDGGHAVSR